MKSALNGRFLLIAASGLLALGLLGASPAAAQAEEERRDLRLTERERREQEIVRRIRQFFLEGLKRNVDLDEGQLRRLVPVLEGLESRRLEATRRRKALATQLSGLVQDPAADSEEIATKLRDLETVERTMREVDQETWVRVADILDVRQQAQFLLYRDEFRKNLEARLSSLRREREQRRAMREGLRLRRQEER